MKTTLVLSTILAGVLASQVALACGAPFGAGVNVDPNQDIIVAHKNGIETYVFKPRFCGVAKDFGLILPIPSKLSVVPALEKDIAFSRLDAMSKPEVQNRTVCRSRGAMDAGVGVPGWSPDAGATVVSTGKVGYLDYAELKADTEKALTDWLTANGFPFDARAQTTFTYYVQKGWYFLAFKISTGAVTEGYACNNLGPVRLSFPSEKPVVPTRMASARPRDTSGSLASYYGFSWHVFGIAPGSTQVGLATGDTYYNKLGFSGLVTSTEAADLAGLAEVGDRVTRITLSFPYGSSDPDVAFSLDPGKDFREIKYNDIVVDCPVPDAGSVDLGGKPDVIPNRDAMGETRDTLTVLPPRDAGIVDALPPPDLQSTAETYAPTTEPRDTAPAATDTSPTTVVLGGDAGGRLEKKSSSGCAMGSRPSGMWMGILGAWVALAVRLRRRSRR